MPNVNPHPRSPAIAMKTAPRMPGRKMSGTNMRGQLRALHALALKDPKAGAFLHAMANHKPADIQRMKTIQALKGVHALAMKSPAAARFFHAFRHASAADKAHLHSVIIHHQAQLHNGKPHMVKPARVRGGGRKLSGYHGSLDGSLNANGSRATFVKSDEMETTLAKYRQEPAPRRVPREA